MERGGSSALLTHLHSQSTTLWPQLICLRTFSTILLAASWVVGTAHDRPVLPDQASPRSSVAVGSGARTLPTPALSYRLVLPGPYQASTCEKARLAVGFPLRCIQRFPLPTIATRPAGRPTTAPPAGRPARSSRTRASPAQPSTRPHRIETELSHDVLNPARVPLSWANSPTLGTGSSPRMRRADIEVPNPAVDLDSWAGSACYPRGSFYPVIYGASTRHHRFTTSWFPTCAGCFPCSQAPLCRCTPQRIAIPPEGTLGRLRYLLGGDRPSQTLHQPRFPRGLDRGGLEGHVLQSGISPAPPAPPQGHLLRLPPILRSTTSPPMASLSQAPRGLFVLVWVDGIFTVTSISPSPWSRQCPRRYAFRAGRNLPDKEFRYLRTVIVTAAVYWGFGSMLAHLPLTFQHWAGIIRYTSAYALAPN